MRAFVGPFIFFSIARRGQYDYHAPYYLPYYERTASPSTTRITTIAGHDGGTGRGKPTIADLGLDPAKYTIRDIREQLKKRYAD